jgi:predicted esterase
VVSVGASLPDEALAAIDWEASGGAGWPRTLWLVGERDVYALPRITSQAELFTGHAVRVTVEIVPGLGHEVPPDLAMRFASWMQ